MNQPSQNVHITLQQHCQSSHQTTEHCRAADICSSCSTGENTWFRALGSRNGQIANWGGWHNNSAAGDASGAWDSDVNS